MPRVRSLLLFQFPAVLLLGWGYLFYSDATQTGPLGDLFAFEIQTLGWASTALNLMLALLALLLLAIASIGLTAVLPETPSLTPPQAPPSPKRFHWRFVFAALLVAALAALFLHDRSRKLYKLDVNAPEAAALANRPANLPNYADFVELRAIPAHRYLASYLTDLSKHSRFHIYEPLVRSGWTPNEPIHYFIHHNGPNSTHFRWFGTKSDLRLGETNSPDMPSLPPEFLADALTPFAGSVTHALPEVIRQDYQARGLKLAPDYIVLDWMRIHHHHVSIWDRYGFFLFLAFLTALTVSILLFTFVFRALANLRARP